MTKHGLFRHMNLQLAHLTDKEIDELLTKNSNAIEDEYIKAEAWDRLTNVLESSGQTSVIFIMKTIYEDVRRDRKL